MTAPAVPRRHPGALRGPLAAMAAAVVAGLAGGAGPSAAATLPPGFSETVVMSGLTTPTAMRFAPDGRVFVAEKAGVVKEFAGVSDTTPRTVVDLRAKVMNYVDRGLLGLAVPPGFPGADPSIYVSYSLDAPIGGTPPVYNDTCPNVATTNCLTGARVSRIDVATGAETVLVEDWCMQYPSHTIGSLLFGADGALYASGGEGADYNLADWGQNGKPPNPCGDAPGPAGTALERPGSQGGALRSQDVRTPADPTGLDGTIIRIHPQTGAGWPGNPFAGSGNANAKRIVAYGMRNPWRMTQRPGTDEIWFSEVGWGTLEEINRLQIPNDAIAENFGWPCFEGTWRQPFYTGLDLCDSLLPAETIAPFFGYRHDNPIVAGENCPNAGASVSGISFVPLTNPYPAAYQGALFFGDYSRSCIWVIQRSGSSGALPDAANVKVFMEGASAPVDIQAGPGGLLYYVDLFGGTIRRLDYSSTKPVASFTASPASGAVPLGVAFDASGSNDPEGTALSYAWKFGDGATATGKTASHTFQQPGRYTVELTVTDASGATGMTTRTVAAGVPAVTIATPSAATPWSVGQQIAFSGSAVDNAGAPIGADKLTWTIVLEHGLCPECHEHAISTKVGASGAFDAPDHGYPSSILLRLTATDDDGLVGTATRRLQPRTTQLTAASLPAGMDVNLDGETAAGPFTRTAIAGSTHSLDAAAIQDGLSFGTWSDNGARAHSFAAPATATTYTATYVNKPPTAAFSVSDSTPDKGQPVTFHASGSSDPEGTSLAYAWDLDDDGGYDDATGVTAARSFTAAGQAIVRLRVEDARGGTGTAQQTLTVDNTPPTASITPGDVSPLIGAPATFTAGGSDPDGTIAERAWDLDGDGEFDDATGATASVTYATAGPKTVRLRVTDDEGATATAASTVSAHGNPVASFTSAPSPVRRNVQVTFTSTSTDPENRLATQSWDLDGDGAYDDGTAATATLTFRTPFGNTIGLRVTDLDGGSDERRLAVVPANVLPAVRVSAFPADPFVQSPVTLTAAASDADGVITGIAWDVDDGAAFDDGTGATITRAFSPAGLREVRAQVTDDAGAVAIGRAAVAVRGTDGTGEPPGEPERVSPAPRVRVATTPTRGGATVRRFSVKAPRGATVRVTCAGKSCPAAKRAQGAGTAKRLHRFERSYRGGTRLVIRVTQPERIGAHVKLKIRSRRRAPVRTDSCLWPGDPAPKGCPGELPDS